MRKARDILRLVLGLRPSGKAGLPHKELDLSKTTVTDTVRRAGKATIVATSR